MLNLLVFLFTKNVIKKNISFRKIEEKDLPGMWLHLKFTSSLAKDGCWWGLVETPSPVSFNFSMTLTTTFIPMRLVILFSHYFHKASPFLFFHSFQCVKSIFTFLVLYTALHIKFHLCVISV